MTGLPPWAKTLPPNWVAKPLKAIAEYCVSSVDKVAEEGEVAVRLCNYNDVYNNDFINLQLDFMRSTATEDEIRKFHLHVDDVVITKDSESWDDIAVPALVTETADDLVCGYHLAILRPARSRILGRFLFRCLQARPIRVQLELASTGVTRFGLPKDEIGGLTLPVPPIRQQQAIAGLLDRETGRLNSLFAAKQHLLGVVADKRQALIAYSVTRGLNPDAPLRDSGIPWLGQIPAHWSNIQFKHACISLQTGPFGSQLHAEDYVEDGTPVINPAHLIEGEIVADRRVTVDESTAERLSLHRLILGDMVFARRGELGRCSIVRENQSGWLCGTGCLRARLKPSVAPEYLALLFRNTAAAELLRLESVGSTMDNLNTEMLGAFPVIIPPAHEQLAIVEHVRNETAKLDELRGATEKSMILLKERRAALIAEAVTGQLQVS
jgi:type I restriction enzyme S subunit